MTSGGPTPQDFVDWLGVMDGWMRGIDGLEQVARARRGMAVHAVTPRPETGRTPHRVVHRQDKLALRYYAPSVRAHRTPVVLVPSLINRATILDLEPDRSLVAALAAQGHPTYLVDWGVPGPEDAGEDVGYVLLELLHRSIDRACRHARSKRAHLFGYCMGGTLAAMYAALRPGRVATLTALAAPVRFSAGGRFRDFAAALDTDRALDPDGLVPVEVMKPAFKMLDPMGNWSKFLGLEAASHDPTRLTRALARERWLEENVPISGAFAREFLKLGYQEDRLLDGTWVVRGEAVDLRRITCPLLVVTCAGDFITPAEAALPLAEATSSAEVCVEQVPTGHIGVVVGGYGPAVFFPMLGAWLAERSTQERTAMPRDRGSLP